MGFPCIRVGETWQATPDAVTASKNTKDCLQMTPNRSKWESYSQLKIMLWRNTLLFRRHWKATIFKCFASPLIFTILLFLLQQSDYSRQSVTIASPVETPLPGVFACVPGPSPCIDIMFSPSTEENRQFLSTFAKLNAERTKQAPFAIDSPISGTIF